MKMNTLIEVHTIDNKVVTCVLDAETNRPMFKTGLNPEAAIEYIEWLKDAVTSCGGYENYYID